MSEYTVGQLTDLYNQWTAIERKRIIKLIEGATCHCETDCDQLPRAKDLLALINLNQKDNQ